MENCTVPSFNNIFHRLAPERIAFLLLLAVVVGFLWLPAYPPMVDVPQHAGQVGVLKSFLLGEERWRDQVTINYMTPYWICYGSWLFASLFFPVSIAFKVVLTFFFLFFVGAFIKMRREFMAPAMLDWIFVPSFFGFAYDWGFVTFLFAVPVGVVFFLLNKRWQETQASKWGWAVLCAGVAMYFSHLLVFLFFCFITPVYIITSCRFKPATVLRFIPPYLIFGILMAIYLLIPDALSFSNHAQSFYGWGSIYEHFTGLLVYPWGMNIKRPVAITLSVAVLLMPFFLGYRPKDKPDSYAVLLSLLVFWFLLPHSLNGTAFVFQRFSVFIFPFYVICFEKSAVKDDVNSKSTRRTGVALGMLVILALLYRPLANQWFFRIEAREFASLLDDLPPHQRALTLVYSRSGRAVDNTFVYLHFPAWYQAEENGWVDFNFAWFSPQVIRYRLNRIPSIRPGFEWNPQYISFIEDCKRYDLLFVRAASPPPADVFKNTPCPHIPYKAQGNWYVFRLPDSEESPKTQ